MQRVDGIDVRSRTRGMQRIDGIDVRSRTRGMQRIESIDDRSSSYVEKSETEKKKKKNIG